MPPSAPTTATRCSLLLRILATATFLFALSGCIDLDDAAGLSKLAEQAKVALPKVSNDVAATCARQNVLFEDTPTAERDKSEQAQDCAPYKDVSDDLAKDQNVLTAYFDALGKLSSNEPVSSASGSANKKSASGSAAGSSASGGSSGAAGSSAKTGGGAKGSDIDADTAAAGSSADTILQALEDAATKGYREKQLGELIKANDPAVQSLTEALKKVITVDYIQLLTNEGHSLDSFYQGPIAAGQSNERLALILVQRQYATDKTELQSRRDAAASYGKIMDDLAALHTKLKQEADNKASVKQISKELGPLIASLADAISALESRSK